MRAIESVIAQTVPVDEIIVVDDGSLDGTAEAIRSRYGSRVAVFTQENAGVSAARNRGIREARCEWIAFLDSDDRWLPTKVERQSEALAALGDKFGLCFTDCVYEGNPELKHSVFQEAGFHAGSGFDSLEDPVRYLLASREPFWTQSLLLRRSLLRDPDGFDEALVLREDTDVMFRLSFRTKFCFVAEPLVQIDRNPSREGLCNLYATRDDRVYRCFQHLYTKWLAMPEVIGTEYEQPIRDLLRLISYDSAECKLRQARLGPALREIGRLKGMGESYLSILAMLAKRKMRKTLRILRATEHRGGRQRTAATPDRP
jgi:glycosyltransferase involved in cell wall biosynthesis